MPKKPKIKQPEDKYVDVLEDLCDTCSNAFKGGCPVWPTCIKDEENKHTIYVIIKC